MLSLNKSYKNRKVSLTIHCKYKYFDSTVQGAEDRRQKVLFRLPFAVNVKVNLSIFKPSSLHVWPILPKYHLLKCIPSDKLCRLVNENNE